MPLSKVKWGGLAASISHEIPAGQTPELAVVLCHGYGASGGDLVSLASYFGQLQPELLQRAAFLFPAAPLDLGSEGLPGGRAWWPIDLDRLLNRPTPELMLQFRRDPPAGLAEAREQFGQWLAAAAKELSLPESRFVLGGFSQGSMIATDWALRQASAPAGLCILSGALVNEAEWVPLAKSRGSMTVFQSHGHQDPILAFPQAQALHELLVETGSDVEFVPFSGGHEIPPAVIRRLAGILMRLLKRVP
jgi:phospholipase/carboxylesterase